MAMIAKTGFRKKFPIFPNLYIATQISLHSLQFFHPVMMWFHHPSTHNPRKHRLFDMAEK
jgi:hypothetical protein